LTAYISGSFLYMALILRHHAFKIYKRGCAGIQHIGDLKHKYRYMASKLDRSDPSFKR